MSTILPPVPNFIFAVFEPLSLIAGFLSPVLSPGYFVNEQIPLSAVDATLSPNTLVVALQLGNLYLLLALLGIGILHGTSEPKVIRNYIIALWIGDIGHAAATYYVLGHENFVDIANWNAMAWGNIGATAFLFVSRTAYLLGLFGPDLIPDNEPSLKKLQ